MRVLIIDDEESIRKMTAMLLEDLGHETVGVENRAGALAQLDKSLFDVAFLDLKLNGESGLDLLPELLKSHPHMDVIVCTAYASIETAVEAMKRGATDYLPKPFTPDKLVQAVQSCITCGSGAQNRIAT